MQHLWKSELIINFSCQDMIVITCYMKRIFIISYFWTIEDLSIYQTLFHMNERFFKSIIGFFFIIIIVSISVLKNESIHVFFQMHNESQSPVLVKGNPCTHFLLCTYWLRFLLTWLRIRACKYDLCILKSVINLTSRYNRKAWIGISWSNKKYAN